MAQSSYSEPFIYFDICSKRIKLQVGARVSLDKPQQRFERCRGARNESRIHKSPVTNPLIHHQFHSLSACARSSFYEVNT
jgi:hypothetical protein